MEWTQSENYKWTVYRSPTIASAVTTLRRRRFPIILSEQNLAPGTWIEMLEQTTLLTEPPVLIVTSRLADECLWAEALNLGAWDVLAKPFDTQEVCRVVEGARQQWRNQHESAA